MRSVYIQVVAGLVFSIGGGAIAVNSLYMHDGRLIPALMVFLAGVLCFPFYKSGIMQFFRPILIVGLLIWSMVLGQKIDKHHKAQKAKTEIRR